MAAKRPELVEAPPPQLPAAPPLDPAIVERVLLHGDLRQLNPAQKIAYYRNVCESLGLNPLTRPFDYLILNGKEQLYPKKDCTDQLRSIHGISIDVKAREIIEGCYVVTAGASFPNGRKDESTGVVAVDGLKGLDRANAYMKAETKAKRRATLSICGLGMLDESELDSVPGARIVNVDPLTGEMKENGNGKPVTVTELPAAGIGQPNDPPDFQAFWAELQTSAEQGWPALNNTFQKAPVLLRNHLMQTRLSEWLKLKDAAMQVRKR